MSLPYPGTSVTGYNANPPPDDGSQTSLNEVTWAGIKTKIGDPLDTFATNVDSNVTAAFEKIVDGSPIVSTSTSYAAGAADQGKLIVAIASGITITTPDAGTVGAPFLFAVSNQSTGTITLAGNSDNSQTVDGETSVILQAGGSCMVKTDGTNWWSIGLKSGTVNLGGNNYGFDAAINCNLHASVASNLLTVALKTKAGNDPSATDPVLVACRDSTAANGDPVWLTITSALSINTNATGATLGTQNNVPFRFWVLMFNNAGTPEMALWHSGAGSSTPCINPLNEGALVNTTGISSGATSAGVFYTPNGVSLTGQAFRILGYVDYSSGLSTAGTYASAPTEVQLFGPGVHKPGEIIQSQFQTTTSSTSVTGTTKTATNSSVSITPTSAVNPVKVSATGTIYSNYSGGASSYGIAQISRGSSPTLIGNVAAAADAIGGASSNNIQVGAFLFAFDQPQSASSVTYTVYIWGGVSTSTAAWLNSGSIGTNTGQILAEEIQA